MSAAVSALLPVVFLIAAGVVLRHTVLREEEQWKGIERLTYYVLFPALIIDTVGRSDLSSIPVRDVGAALAIPIVLMAALCLALRPILARRLGMGDPSFTSVMQGSMRWNTYVALPLAGSFYGAPGVALTAVAIVAMVPLLNVINVWALVYFASPEPRNARTIIVVLLGNPLIWSCIIGLAFNLFGIPIEGPIHAFADALGRASLACGPITVGAGLHVAALMRPAAPVLIATSLKLILMPAMAIGLGAIIGLEGAALGVVACCSAVPAPSGTYVLARQMGGDAALMAQIITFETALAVLTMPVALGLASL
jgi:predicted permease